MVGHTTLQYGTEGIEATCDARLRGDVDRTPWQAVQAGLLHETAVGRDVRLTSEELALAFIAFAVGSELYLNELRSRMTSIIYMIITQVVVTFLLVSLAMFFLLDWVPFASEIRLGARISISMLAGTIAIARSPASAIAIINELRARGPFTQTALGVTVVKDFGVIVLFAIIFKNCRKLQPYLYFLIISLNFSSSPFSMW